MRTQEHNEIQQQVRNQDGAGPQHRVQEKAQKREQLHTEHRMHNGPGMKGGMGPGSPRR
ncbi:MAG: hypothetical protein MZW92_46480 [Comamonadaceae bacterium]|nr:hypothetical protein [Comamonadaceae bacterium]